MAGRRVVRRRGGRRLRMAPAVVAAGGAMSRYAGRYAPGVALRGIGRRFGRGALRAGAAAGAVGAAGSLGYGAYQRSRTANVRRSNDRSMALTKKRSSRQSSTATQMMDVVPTIRKSVRLGFVRGMDRKVLKLGFNHRVSRWQKVRVLNAGTPFPGSLNLNHLTVETNKTLVPCYLFCLNHCNNQSTLTTGPMYQLKFNDSGGVELNNRACQNPDATETQFKWVTEKAFPGFNSGEEDPQVRYIMNAWYDIRLNCYGANSQPTMYDVSVVSFNSDYLDPLETPSSAQEVADRHATYQQMIHRFMSNPIMPVNTVKKLFKVHSSVRFTLQPTLNIENDTTPQSRIIRMFVRDGRMYDYCYHGDGFAPGGADNALSTTQFAKQGTSSPLDYSDVPTARVRKWLIIRAMNTTRSEVESVSNTPSFDLIVRKGEYLQAR